MKRILLSVFLLLITACAVLLGGIFLLSKYAYQVEEKTGLVAHNNAEELLQEPPEQTTNATLDIFAPPNNYVSSNQVVILKGKTAARWIVVGHNNTFVSAPHLDNDGKFSLSISLSSTVNQIIISGQSTNGRLFTKELVIGYMPKASSNQRAYLGEIMAIQPDGVSIVTATDTLGMNLTKAKLQRVDDKTTTPITRADLEITQRLGVISAPLVGNAAVPLVGQVSLFPYTFSGKIVEKTSQGITVERWTKGARSTALLGPTALVYDRFGEKKGKANLAVGTMVIVTGYLIPGEDRSQFHTNYIIHAE